jgi:septal ring factor EnvC (AmiA/AmiB activator)
MYKLLESDDALATAHEEIKRLNLRNAQLETRLHGLMNERNEAIKMVKDLQKQLDKLKVKK